MWPFMMTTIAAWTPSGWRSFHRYQLPVYPDPDAVMRVEEEMNKKPPIVFAGEIDRLKHALALASMGEAFVFMGGDCAETFDDFQANKIRDDFRLLMELSLLLSYASGLPVITIGRMAGQFAKPRSDDVEIRLNETLPAYRGDIINGFEFDRDCRIPDPGRMISAYHQSVQTLNLIRAFIQGGWMQIKNIKNNWRLEKNRHILVQLERSLQLLRSLNLEERAALKYFFVGHECLLLPYEEALTRRDSISNRIYDCSAHFVWLGERTRRMDGAHVEFMRGIANPIGIKVSEKISPDELIQLVRHLNPSNEPGRITLITRMGNNLRNHLPAMIRRVREEELFVLWCCDPMHANTFSMGGIKTRSITDILHELDEYFSIHAECGTFPGGIHLEMTSQNVSECIDPEYPVIQTDQYKTTCDPRLNIHQSIDILLTIGNRLLLQHYRDFAINRP